MTLVTTVSYEISDADFARALAFIEPDPFGGCWLWAGPPNAYGYGILTVAGDEGPRWLFAHRAMFVRLRGPVPATMTLDHRCRVRCCVNPDHLRVRTKRRNVLENSVSLAAINAAKVVCLRGHAFTPENTYIVPKTGHRNCRSCRSESGRRYRALAA